MNSNTERERFYSVAPTDRPIREPIRAMTVAELIRKLSELNIPHALVKTFCAETGEIESITGWIYDEKQLEFQCDEI